MSPIIYKVNIITQTVASRLTNTNIYITLYGEQGNSGEIYLGTVANKLAQGDVDVFIIDGVQAGSVVSWRSTLDSQQIGNINKIRVRYSNGHKSGLILTSVLLDEERTGKEWVCSRNRWLADDEDDSSLVSELHCSKV